MKHAIVIAAIIAVLGYQVVASSSSTAASPGDVLAPGGELGPPLVPRRGRLAAPAPAGERRGALAGAGGSVLAGTTVFDDGIPGVANLDRALLRALREAAADAGDEGVELSVNSGWRSAEHQGRLLREAVARYGSEKQAARWVASPGRSAHVSGDAVDIGFAGMAWLAEHGAEYGLCRVYDNEPWHFELRPEATNHRCPATYPDPTHDPRMR